jgi:superfamily II DNA/RNA helicase
LQHISLKDVSVLVVDEADLLFSFGYEQDVRALLNHMGPIFQSFLMSATMTNVCARPPCARALTDQDKARGRGSRAGAYSL